MPNARLWSAASLLICLSLAAPAAAAETEPAWKIGTATIGAPKYQEGFKRFDYVNPDAPKGGTLRLTGLGTFDTYNPLVARGELASGIGAPATPGLIYETLMKRSMDEISATYGLLAEAIAYPEDYSFVKFRLRAEAKWEDGQPVTPDDVIFSFESAKANDPKIALYYQHVTKVEKTGEREVTFTFDEKGNRELPQIVGDLIVVPKHWWTGKDAKGTPRDISKTSLELPWAPGPTSSSPPRQAPLFALSGAPTTGARISRSMSARTMSM